MATLLLLTVLVIILTILTQPCAGADLPTGWQERIHQKALNERRSQLTTMISPNGTFFDDQVLHPDSEEYSTGALPSFKLWPNNGKNIPYEAATNLGDFTVTQIELALQAIVQQTTSCITFKKRTTEENYIAFSAGSRCQSPVGKQGGRQVITVTPKCAERGLLQHMVLHAVGLFHEHQRPDRDKHVLIYADHAINGSMPRHFRILHKMPVYGTPYDIQSIMHYGPYDFAKSKRIPVMIPKKGRKTPMGQRASLSRRDLLKVYSAYNCSVMDANVEGGEPLPSFAKDYVSREQCNLVAAVHCQDSEWTLVNCTSKPWLKLACDKDVTDEVVLHLSTAMARYPLRYTVLNVYDGSHLDRDAFNPIRRQIIEMSVLFCYSPVTTQRMAGLYFPNLISLRFSHCYNLNITRRDFTAKIAPSSYTKLRILDFHRSTIQALEQGTFTDLPALRLLAMETKLHFMYSFVPVMRQYLNRLHCGCTFAWLRLWRKTNARLMVKASWYEVFFFEGIRGNYPYDRRDVYYPIDCNVKPFPWTHNQIDYAQMEYSLHEPNCTHCIKM
ncbi:uncharacterized protein LOC129591518 [Paramacrobiotus metropolitanus]|uniref:uncharacterized protein LOC129591518 n=1 Tax=Paramacrobiotus metropolitanus TaxID=2943436 RepID=UPI0024461BBA|nr:uncharacterized protein LOC129591518 [Paramacrobiotus metropolitanus]